MFVKNIPNFITIFRVLVVPFFIFFLFQFDLKYRVVALILFSLASISDFLDGYIARKYDLVSTFGKITDPFADKILILSAFFVLYKLYPNNVHFWMILVIFLRDIVITGYRYVLQRKRIILQANYLAKMKTLFQIATIHLLLIFHIIYFDINSDSMIFFNRFFYIIMIFCTFFTVYTGVDYFKKADK